METTGDQIRSFLLSLGVHLLFVAMIVIGLAWTHANRPVSAAGPIIEATLVNATMPALPRPKAAPAPKPTPPTPKPEEPKPKPEETSKLPPILPKGEDKLTQEKIDRAALEKAKAEHEQEEKIRKEQQVLDQEERLTKMDREKREQLDDIRKKLDAAQKKRELEQQRLAQLEDLAKKDAKPAPAAPPQPPEARPLPGNQGTDTDLLARYQAAIQSVVLANWLRPDSAQPGVECNLSITQIPGGEVIEVHVVPPCNADDITRRSIEAAVQRAQPLPYQGYEKVFLRSISFKFHYDG